MARMLTRKRGLAAIVALTLCGVARADGPDFERHVAALLGKHGCNGGACHGSFQGRGGFRLSLFGHDPRHDFLALTHEALGRRVSVAEPDRSLVLLKATGQVPHAGGRRFEKDGEAYRILRDWIASGCRHEPGSGAVKELRVEPQEHVLRGPGETAALRVLVEFADGSRADVTPFCDFRVRDDTVADVSPQGQVRGLAAGETPIIVSYRGHLAAGRVLIPAPAAPGFVYPRLAEANYIDREVFARLRRLNIVPSELADDAEFLRRVTIDTIGTLPSPAEVRTFLADRDPGKRDRKIEALLAHPLHAALWATRLCDITACNVDVMDGPAEQRGKRARMWHDWFRCRVAENRPYDEIVRGVLTATSREGLAIPRWIEREVSDIPYERRATLDLFWRRLAGEEFFPVEQMAELTAAAFLGVRIECAQCHKHPFDRWTQADYRSYANVFARVRLGSSAEVTAVVADRLAQRRALPPEKAGPPLPRLREVYIAEPGERRQLDPVTNEPLPARALGGPVLDEREDPRQQLVRWLVKPENPYFAHSFVNRVWAHYFGTGLVEPVDNFSVANPPSNDRLLDALARDFAAHGYDLRRLERTILQSRTYQLSSAPNATNARDRTQHSHAVARPMLAEVVVDVLNAALGASDELGPDLPRGRRAIEVAANKVQAPYLARVFRIFGRPLRTATCDCERPRQPALPQTLFLMADPVLLQKMRGGRLQALVAEGRPDADLVEELFLATLSRLPDTDERTAALQRLHETSDRLAGGLDLLWALINTREFILNH
jgi:hypothetical protein